MTGKIMNHDYRATARDHNITINTVTGDDLSDFPIEKARYRSIWYFIAATSTCTTGYGWAVQTKTASFPESHVSRQSLTEITTALGHSFNIAVHHWSLYRDNFQCERL
jgi:hypothetical protein